MKSYLSLIPIAERKNKKQSRMTRICIILAVFLVTVIFGLADMEIRSQIRQTIRDNGYWHVSMRGLSSEDADTLHNLAGVDCVCGYNAANTHLDEGYSVCGKSTMLCGFDTDFQKIYVDIGCEGKIPSTDNETMITKTMAVDLKKTIGDKVELCKSDGTKIPFTITGIMEDTGMIYEKDCYGMCFSVEGLKMITGQNQDAVTYFVKLKNYPNIRKTIEAISNQYATKCSKIGENIKLLGLTGRSHDSYMMELYGTAVVLAILVILSGILMITSNINSTLAKRTEFFGMLRCLGASKRQIKIFVTLEALNWCRTAIPIGVFLGIMVTCMLCGLLRFLSPVYFADMPILALSPIAIISGCVVGILTVLLAAVSPANKAAAVSPVTAVSGNAYGGYKKQAKMHLGILPIDLKLGIRHSYGTKKNFMLMVCSFALSIILFLSFSTGIDFLHHAIRPMQVYTPDLSIYNSNNVCEIDKSIVEKIKQLSGIKNVYGRSFAYSISTIKQDGTEGKINLITYEDTQFHWAEKKVMEGSILNVINKEQVMTVFDAENPYHVGDKISIQTQQGMQEVKVGAILTDAPFTQEEGVENVICSEKTFEQMTGNKAYTIIDVQLARGATQDTVDKIRTMFPDQYIFSDQREDNRNVRGAFLSMAVFMYGFIGIIALISMFQIMNSIAMSTTSRIHEYGVMRAVGAGTEQIIRMITAETVSYGLAGMALGVLIGLPLHRILFLSIITSRWGDIWKIPAVPLCIILLVVGFSCIAALYRPAKDMKKMIIVNTLTTY